MASEILVVCYSRTGRTRALSAELAKQLGADLHEIKDLKDRAGLLNWFRAGRDATKDLGTDIDNAGADPSAYKLVVVGTPVWAWNMAPAVRTWLEQNKGRLGRVAFFTSSGGTGPEKIVGKMEQVCGLPALAQEGFYDREDKEPQARSARLNAFAQRILQSAATQEAR